MKPATDYIRHAARLARKLQMDAALGGTPPPDAEFYKVLSKAFDEIADFAGRAIYELSGGMQQRALIAKALASEPTLLALDEPTTGVDAESQESLGILLEELREQFGVTILYVSHEFGAVEHVVDRIVLVRGGIVYDGPPSGLPGVWHDPSHSHA